MIATLSFCKGKCSLAFMDQCCDAETLKKLTLHENNGAETRQRAAATCRRDKPSSFSCTSRHRLARKKSLIQCRGRPTSPLTSRSLYRTCRACTASKHADPQGNACHTSPAPNTCQCHAACDAVCAQAMLHSARLFMHQLCRIIATLRTNTSGCWQHMSNGANTAVGLCTALRG